MATITIDRKGEKLVKEGNAKEVIDWLEATATPTELQEIKEQIKNGSINISGEDTEGALKTLDERLNLRETETKLNELDNRIKELEGKTNEIEISDEMYKKAQIYGKRHGLSAEEYVNKALAERLKRYEGLTFTTVEDLYKLFDIPDNDRLKNYQLMIQLFNNVYRSARDVIGDGKFDEIPEATARSNVIAHETFIKPLIGVAKIFEIEDEIISTLKLNNIEEGNLPFPAIALDCKVWIENRLYLGFLIGSYFDEQNIHYKGISMVYAKRNEQEEFRLEKDFIILEKDKSKLIAPEQKRDKAHSETRKFIYSFLNFINSPEVEIKETSYNPKNNQRRQARGRIPLPPSKKIYIHGEQLKRFIADINEGVRRFGYSHRFWVRGHYEHFRNIRKFKRLYALSEDELRQKGYFITKNGIIRKFVQSFLKGRGVLIEKSYKVEK